MGGAYKNSVFNSTVEVRRLRTDRDGACIAAARSVRECWGGDPVDAAHKFLLGKEAPVRVAGRAAVKDPEVIYRAVLAPIAALFGGENSWHFYLARRFAEEVVVVVAAALLGYWLLTQLARRSQEHPDADGGSFTSATSSRARPGGRGTPSTSTGTGTGAGGSLGGGEVVFMAADALTAPLARTMLVCVLAINVARNTTNIIDGFITRFNPKLPNDWLDDLVRLLVQSLTPLDGLLTKLSLVCAVLCSCAVVLRWKDILVSHYLLPRVEALDKGPDLVANFINPTSNLLNWIVIVASAVWLAMALGINLQPLLAVGGASGIIIGLATQQVLGNFVSGLNIFLTRPFVAGEYISLISQNLASQTNVSGRVIRVDPMRTLIATEDCSTVTVPNQVIAVSIVVNRTRSPHWSVGKATPLLANPRELRWRMKLPHAALDKLEELEDRIEEALDAALPEDKVRHTMAKVSVVKFVDSGAEIAAKVNLAWRLSNLAPQPLERMEKQEELIQSAMLSLQKVVRSYGGIFQTAA